ncbi:MAG TPA: MBOAT family O-acyltransferase [Gammaproteobacteria bacterium]
MLFSSYEFIFLFLPIVFGVYFFLNKVRLVAVAKWFLLLASLFFYSYWNVIYLPLILVSILFNYAVGKMLLSGRHVYIDRRTILVFGIAANVLLLAYFKYADFFIRNINLVLDTHFSLLRIALPLAISFYTFQQIAYLVDSYKGKIRNQTFLTYALFVTFFPQLIAGPIVHYREMMPQFGRIRNMLPSYSNIADGLFLFSIGLFKKVVIADTFALWSDAGFKNAADLNLLEAWAASLSFGFQLYFDFSGYMDMATGVALLFNIGLPANFRSPYKALDIQDFWNRWHITLSRFLRDYISLPLKRLHLNIYANILLTFLISGIWHGAGWTFIVWGGLHGMALAIHRAWKTLGFRMHYLPAWFVMFIFLNIVRVFFRAEDMDQALIVLKAMFAGQLVLPATSKSMLGFMEQFGVSFDIWHRGIDGNRWTFMALLAAFIIVTFCKNSLELKDRFRTGLMSLLYSLILVMCSWFFLDRKVEFVYFNF